MFVNDLPAEMKILWKSEVGQKSEISHWKSEVGSQVGHDIRSESNI